jgi:NTP pyrophosphatase (non-canonical NTP hydrolase)
MRNKRAGSEHLPIHFLGDVAVEVGRARRLFPGQEDTLTPHEWLSILVEEVGEVGRGLNDGGVSAKRPLDREALYEELVQVGAMAARFALSIKNRGR